MARRGLPQPGLPDEGQVGVRIVLRSRRARPLDGRRIWRDVHVEVLEPQEIAARRVRDRAHAIDPDAGDMLQAGGAMARHEVSPCGFNRGLDLIS